MEMSFTPEDFFGGAKLVSIDRFLDIKFFCITRLELHSLERNKMTND